MSRYPIQGEKRSSHSYTLPEEKAKVLVGILILEATHATFQGALLHFPSNA
jgi:hypothetical protein